MAAVISSLLSSVTGSVIANGGISAGLGEMCCVFSRNYPEFSAYRSVWPETRGQMGRFPEGQPGIGDGIGTAVNDVTLSRCQYVIPASYLLSHRNMTKGQRRNLIAFRPSLPKQHHHDSYWLRWNPLFKQQVWIPQKLVMSIWIPLVVWLFKHTLHIMLFIENIMHYNRNRNTDILCVEITYLFVCLPLGHFDPSLIFRI